MESDKNGNPRIYKISAAEIKAAWKKRLATYDQALSNFESWRDGATDTEQEVITVAIQTIREEKAQDSWLADRLDESGGSFLMSAKELELVHADAFRAHPMASSTRAQFFKGANNEIRNRLGVSLDRLREVMGQAG